MRSCRSRSGGKLLEHALLMWPRPHLEPAELHRAERAATALPGDFAFEALSVALGGVGLERRIEPVLVEGGTERLQEMRLLRVREPHIPLEPSFRAVCDMLEEPHRP